MPVPHQGNPLPEVLAPAEPKPKKKFIEEEGEQEPTEDKERRINEGKRKKAQKMRLSGGKSEGKGDKTAFWDDLKKRFKMQRDLGE